DLLAGAIIVTLLQRLLRDGYFTGVAIALAVAIISTTKFADWWHVSFADSWFKVTVPPIDSDALVLITTSAPVGYVLPFLPADARHLGAVNTINAPTRGTKLSEAVAAAVRHHDGVPQPRLPPIASCPALAR